MNTRINHVLHSTLCEVCFLLTTMQREIFPLNSQPPSPVNLQLFPWQYPGEFRTFARSECTEDLVHTSLGSCQLFSLIPSASYSTTCTLCLLPFDNLFSEGRRMPEYLKVSVFVSTTLGTACAFTLGFQRLLLKHMFLTRLYWNSPASPRPHFSLLADPRAAA